MLDFNPCPVVGPLFLQEVLILGDRGVDSRKLCVIIRKTVSYYL
jgi:hypothetical protein